MSPVATFTLRLATWAVPMILITYVLWGVMEPTSVDEHYAKLSATSELNGLLVGSSRMSQGVVPSRAFAGSQHDKRVLNFAFTNQTSPYGEVYNQAILDRSSEMSDAMFVLEINPWIFARDKHESEPRERGRILDGLVQIQGHPNMDYAVRKMSRQWYEAALGPEHPLYVEEDGWLHVELDWSKMDMDSCRIEKLKRYQKLKGHYALDSVRLSAFFGLVDSLKMRGKVVGLELPVSRAMAELEAEVFPEFESWVQKIAADLRVVRLRDSLHYETHDGNHLLPASARALSDWLANSGALYPN